MQVHEVTQAPLIPNPWSARPASLTVLFAAELGYAELKGMLVQLLAPLARYTSGSPRWAAGPTGP